ncbi:SPOR domain-containing protein [Gilvimarinus agarilyticus]|uniref:SPOR domain-containing protein n=1 Tax=Gilvimarinus agarilyticus TaxID=679259 RepID=UPI0005A1C095|nr:AAA family ATPase [Gilvimarinus agarilyticus]
MVPDYCERLGLDSDPFTNDTFYVTPDLELLADQITHASQFSAGFVVVCGERGVGKSAFAKFFYGQLMAIQESVLLDASVASSSQALLLQLADFLALPVSDSSSIGEILAQLRTTINSGGEALGVTVVLDSVHLLDDDTLAALVSLLQVPAGHSRPFSFVLFSELELAPRLDQFEMPDVAVQDLAFPLMSASDATAMLNYRVELAGFLGEPIFSLRQVESFMDESGGRLDKLLELARLELQSYSPESVAAASAQNESKGGIPVVHIAAVAGLLAALGLVYLYQGDDTAEPTEQGVVKRLPAPEAPKLERKITEPVVTAPPAPEAVKPIEPPAEAVRQEPAVSIKDEVTGRAEPAVSGDAAEASGPSREAEPEMGVVGEPVKPDAAVVSSAATSSDVVPQEPPVATKPAAVTWPNDEAEILSWPESDYSLQVLGVSSRDAAIAYVKKQDNVDSLRVMETVRSQKPWYIVLAGRYSSAAKAKQAVATLPKSQIKAGPWPRRVGELQQEIGL